MLTLLTVDAGFLSATLGYASDIWGDVSALVALAIGLPLGFWLARKVISIARTR